VKAAVDRLRGARSVCVLTGSGISAESGLPTFRGIGGLWHSHRVEDLASPQGFENDPQLVWTWYNERRAAHAGAQPNAGHAALAALEGRYPDFTLVTQNVDSLHQRAGSQRVVELHGSLREARCSRCGERRTLEGDFPLEAIDHACGGRFRPGVVWFGEPLPAQAWTAAAEAAGRAEVMLVIGTSGIVNPAALLASHYARAAYIVEINPEETVLTGVADCSLRAMAAAALPEILDALAAS
jgi:NAD-dependent deacetylase